MYSIKNKISAGWFCLKFGKKKKNEKLVFYINLKNDLFILKLTFVLQTITNLLKYYTGRMYKLPLIKWFYLKYIVSCTKGFMYACSICGKIRSYHIPNTKDHNYFYYYRISVLLGYGYFLCCI